MEPYRVPFVLDRSRAPVYRLTNISSERLRGVTVLLHGPGVLTFSPPGVLAPTQSLTFTVRGTDLTTATTVVVRWLRPLGEDYLWRVSF